MESGREGRAEWRVGGRARQNGVGGRAGQNGEWEGGQGSEREGRAEWSRMQYITVQKQLGDHPHIIKYMASAGIPPSDTSHGNAEFLIQTELCDGECMCFL
jgi:hypothetical protein